MELENVSEFCSELAVKAGKLIMDIYNEGLIVEEKADHSPVTRADRVSNELIVTELGLAYPQCGILAEESVDDLSRLEREYCFLVDPLDGTKEFIRHRRDFTVNIALSCRGKSVMGVIFVPVTGEMYRAWQGGGAWYRSFGGSCERICVTDKLEELTFVGSASHSTEKEKDLLKTHADVISNFVTSGSSIKGCMVARGKADIYYRYGPTWEWDTAAMQCIVEEAGGVFGQLDGSQMTYNRQNPLNDRGFYAVNRERNVWL